MNIGLVTKKRLAASTIENEDAAMWQATSEHVIPLDDLRSHEETPQCWCQPFDDEGVWIHNSMDRREFVERGEIVKS